MKVNVTQSILNLDTDEKMERDPRAPKGAFDLRYVVMTALLADDDRRAAEIRAKEIMEGLRRSQVPID